MDLALTDFQEEVCFSPSRFLGFFGGRRLGKSECFKNRFKVKALGNRDFRYGYLTPTSLQNEEVFEALLADEMMEPHIKHAKSRPCRMWLKNGSYLGMNSFQRSKNIRGKFFDEIWGDESQDLNGVDFWRVVRPMLSDRRGTAVVSGQLTSKMHWTYKDFFEPGQAAAGSALNPFDNGIPRYQSWAIPSSRGPVFWDEAGKKELEIARQQLPKWIFDTEYNCIPTAALNCVFRPDDLEAIQSGGTITAGPHYDGKFIIGHDIGRVIDSGATVVMRHTDGVVFHAARFPLGMKHADQARELETLSRRFNNALVCIDTTGGGGGGKTPADQVAGVYRSVIPHSRSVYMPWQTKGEIISSLCIAVEQRKIAIPKVHRDLLEEMSAYEATYSNGYWQYSAPKGAHDDLVIALALAQWGRFKKWNSWDEENTYRGII